MNVITLSKKIVMHQKENSKNIYLCSTQKSDEKIRQIATDDLRLIIQHCLIKNLLEKNITSLKLLAFQILEIRTMNFDPSPSLGKNPTFCIGRTVCHNV